MLSSNGLQDPSAVVGGGQRWEGSDDQPRWARDLPGRLCLVMVDQSKET